MIPLLLLVAASFVWGQTPSAPATTCGNGCQGPVFAVNSYNATLQVNITFNGNALSYATSEFGYQVAYSFAQITNSNYRNMSVVPITRTSSPPTTGTSLLYNVTVWNSMQLVSNTIAQSLYNALSNGTQIGVSFIQSVVPTGPPVLTYAPPQLPPPAPPQPLKSQAGSSSSVATWAIVVASVVGAFVVAVLFSLLLSYAMRLRQQG